MNGVEHYRAAERLLSQASFTHSKDDPQSVTANGHELHFDAHAALIRRALVHAILAQTAAVAMPTVRQTMGDARQVTAWADAIGWDYDDQRVRS